MRPHPNPQNTDHSVDQHTDVAELRAVTTAAAQIFTAPPRRAAALTYLRQRGINPDHVPAGWPLGYAPPGWTRLIDTLHGQYSDQALLDAGLARVSSRGSLIDTFRDRVIFPVHHAHGELRGQVAGFIGRDLSGHTGTPKYLNSRHSSIYVKSELLYGLHEGRTATRSPSTIVVVEGPLDVLAITARTAVDAPADLWPVAASGTAFTSAHARQIAAHTDQPNVVVALDGDAAGRAAALVAGERLHGAGLNVRIAVLPNGMDPADYLSDRSSTLDTFTSDNAIPLLSVQVEQAIAAQGDHMQWIEGRLAAARNIAHELTSYPVNQVASQIGWIANTLHIDYATFTNELLTAFRSTKLTPHRTMPSTTFEREPIIL